METDNISNVDESKSLEDDEPNSIIKTVLDQFAITTAIKKIFDKTSLKATKYFNDAIILLIFLLIIFIQSDALKLDFSLPIITITILTILIILEFVGANTSIFKRFFFSEEKSQYFIDNIGSYRTSEIERRLQILTFSPNNINSVLLIIKENKNQIHPFIVEYILRHNTLSTKNLDLLFSPEIIKQNLNKGLIIDLLIKYNDKLSIENIENIYTIFRDDDVVIKSLFATQRDSYSLLDIFPENNLLKELCDKCQRNIKIKKTFSKYIKHTKIRQIRFRLIVSLFLWFFLWIAFTYYAFSNWNISSSNFSILLYTSFFISGFIAPYIGVYIADLIIVFWIDKAKRQFRDALNSL